MRHLMMTMMAGAVCTSLAFAPDAMAEDDKTAEQVCRKAEINPVTGHVLCLEPRGAYVPPPPDDIAPACTGGAGGRNDWTWSPNCRDPKGS